jgi:hypothetical protein
MPSHMSDIGFALENEEDFRRIALLALENGEALEAGDGTYVKWSPGRGIELWLQLDTDETIVGLNPHFSGSARMPVALTARVTRSEDGFLDGGFHGWANPSAETAESGDYPFVFDAPDYQLYGGIELPSVLDVQLAAFAHELEAYESDEAHEAAQADEMKFAPESFLPIGLFSPEGKRTDPPQALAILSGHVLATSIITNPVTDSEFCWARVRTLGGEVDMVADPQTLNGFLVEGGVVSGSFWLSGRLLKRRR